MSCLISVNSPFISYSCAFMFSFLFFQAVFRLTPPSLPLGGRSSSIRRPRLRQLVGSRQSRLLPSGRPGSGVKKLLPGQQGKGALELRVRGGPSPRKSRSQFGTPFLRPCYPLFPSGMTLCVRRR